MLAAIGGSALLSLRPDARVERWIDVALAPTRVLAELCAPIRWLRRSSTRAAEGDLAAREEVEYAQRVELHEAQRRAAQPSLPELVAGRRFVHAEVVGRREQHFDQLVVRVDGESCGGLARGMPVAAGDSYVGRVLELDEPEPSYCVVELVTARTFAVGATLPAAEGGEPARAIVGGLVSKRSRDPLRLSVTNPSRRDLLAGPVAVDELLSPLARFADASSGFLLGDLVEHEPGTWAVAPRVDFASGLFEVVIVAPGDIARPADPPPHDELFDGRWRAVRATSGGEPGLAREGLEIGSGRWDGARDGAALVVGARLVGRVEHAGALTSDARTLGDRGFALHALARIEGRDEPFVLGRIVSLGRPEDGGADEVVIDWPAVVPIPASGDAKGVRARLFTGSGDTLVPRGLVLGEAELPVGPGPHRFRLVQGVDTRDVRRLWMRLDRGSAP